jgi:hypothetical protein
MYIATADSLTKFITADALNIFACEEIEENGWIS